MKLSIFCILMYLGLSIAQDHCTDSMYLNLKSKDINAMSDREYQYFMLKEKECIDSQKNSIDSYTVKIMVKNINPCKGHNRDTKEILLAGGIYFDNVLVTKDTVAIIKCVPGKHKISFFSDASIEAEGPFDKRRMLSSVFDIFAEPNKFSKVVMKFICDCGMNNLCDENEWKFEVSKVN